MTPNTGKLFIIPSSVVPPSKSLCSELPVTHSIINSSVSWRQRSSVSELEIFLLEYVIAVAENLTQMSFLFLYSEEVCNLRVVLAEPKFVFCLLLRKWNFSMFNISNFTGGEASSCLKYSKIEGMSIRSNFG